MKPEFVPGTPCMIHYKSGRYIAEFVEKSMSSSRAVVKISAVLEHPEQGDLHHPYQADVPLFHQRKASAYLEHVLVPQSSLELFQGTIPEYGASLLDAFQKKWNELAHREDAWSIKAKEQLSRIRTEYGF